MTIFTILLNLFVTQVQAADLNCVIALEQNGVVTEVAGEVVAEGSVSHLKYGDYQGEVRRNGVNTILILNDTKSGMATYTSFQCDESGSSDLINHKTKEKVSIRCNSQIPSNNKINNSKTKKEKSFNTNEVKPIKSLKN